jgi:hypothetical protein
MRSEDKRNFSWLWYTFQQQANSIVATSGEDGKVRLSTGVHKNETVFALQARTAFQIIYCSHETFDGKKCPANYSQNCFFPWPAQSLHTAAPPFQNSLSGFKLLTTLTYNIS